MSETVGFIGLGAMGEPMAGNLVKAGFEVRVYNRTASKAEALVAQGARRVSLATEAVRPGGLLVTMLADDAALEAVAGEDSGMAEQLGFGGVHLSMSTVSPKTARHLAELHARAGAAYVAGPVFGRPDAAAAAKLWICLSGPREAKARVQPLLKAMGQGSFDFGEDAGAANVAKLAGNFLLAAAIESMAEALAMAERNGVDKGAVAEMLGRTLFACPVYQNYGRAIAQQNFQPAGFRLALGLKDLKLALETARTAGASMPVGELVRGRLEHAVVKGRADWDWAALALGAFEGE